MLRFLFFLLVLGSTQSLKGQQIISSTGGLFENERITCQMTMGEIETGAGKGSVSSPIQIIPGTFSPSNGIIVPTGNEQLSTKDLAIKLSITGGCLMILQSAEIKTECNIYSVKGEVLYHSTFQITRHEIPLHSLSRGIYFIQIVQNKYYQTYKINIP